MKNTTITAQIYTNLLRLLKKEHESLPAGYLVIRGKRYSQHIDGRDYGITQKTDKIQQLARKRYVDVLIQEITEYLNTPLKDIHLHKFPTHKEIIRSFPPTVQALPDAYFKLSSLEAWIAEPFIKRSDHKDGLKFPTKSSFEVRSKEEVILANTLTDNDIPFKYEAPFQLGKITVHPDFTLINPYTGKQSIWEHLGSFHIEKYGEQANQKILAYIQSGLLLNETLIITYANDITTPGRIEAIIENIILKI